MTFTINRLVGNRAVIAGNDKFGTVNSIVVDTTQWDDINKTTQFDQAQEAFEAAVEEFYAPILEAAEKAKQAIKRPTDSIGYVVLHEGVEATAGQAEHLIHLNHDSILMRVVESGNTDRLMWVGDNLEVLEVDTPLPGVGDSSDDEAYAGADADEMFGGDEPTARG